MKAHALPVKGCLTGPPPTLDSSLLQVEVERRPKAAAQGGEQKGGAAAQGEAGAAGARQGGLAAAGADGAGAPAAGGEGAGRGLLEQPPDTLGLLVQPKYGPHEVYDTVLQVCAVPPDPGAPASGVGCEGSPGGEPQQCLLAGARGPLPCRGPCDPACVTWFMYEFARCRIFQGTNSSLSACSLPVRLRCCR